MIVLRNFLVFRISGRTGYFTFAHMDVTFSGCLVYIAEVVDGKEIAAVTLNYGNFLQVTFDFLIIAFSIFLFIKLLTRLTAKKEAEVPAAPPAPPAPSKEEVLLTEIRDILKEKK